jgi:hypothetical protein
MKSMTMNIVDIICFAKKFIKVCFLIVYLLIVSLNIIYNVL